MSRADMVRLGVPRHRPDLITAGVIVRLLRSELWVTNIFAHEKQTKGPTPWRRSEGPGRRTVVPAARG